MKPPKFQYVAPQTLGEAVSLISAVARPRILAGGQSLVPMLAMRLTEPACLIDLNRIPELDQISIDGDDIIIGAMVRQRRLERDLDVLKRFPIIPTALRFVGHMQTRNRGTIGGSLCHLDPSAELPALACCYDAVLNCVSARGKRSIVFSEFPSSYLTSTLAEDEILTSIRFSRWTGRVGFGFQEFARRHGDFAIAGAVVLVQLAADADIVERSSLTLFGVAAAPVRVKAAEELLMRERPDAELIRRAAEACRSMVTQADMIYSADYRADVAVAMAEKALQEAFKRARQEQI